MVAKSSYLVWGNGSEAELLMHTRPCYDALYCQNIVNKYEKCAASSVGDSLLCCHGWVKLCPHLRGGRGRKGYRVFSAWPPAELTWDRSLQCKENSPKRPVHSFLEI